MAKARILSGVQPTGDLHIGNWLGAIRNWVDLQETHETFLCVVDLHALTTPQDPQELAKNTLKTAGLYIACGIKPELCSIFIQSQVSANSELCWLLNCLKPLNWMERMIQFKEKAKKQGESVSIGLFDYPVLMAADILLYDADLVPVGEDQKQHLELARDIAQQRINCTLYKGKESSTQILKVPKALISKEGAKVMSLTDGNNKMSKSDVNESSRINLLDPPDLITKKIKRAKTDSQLGLEFGNPNRPEADNLLSLYSLLSGKDRQIALEECSNMGWGSFKPLLAEAAVSSIQPIQARYNELMKDPEELNLILREGKNKANQVAEKTLSRVHKALGLLSNK